MTWSKQFPFRKLIAWYFNDLVALSRERRDTCKVFRHTLGGLPSLTAILVRLFLQLRL
jgi:hypothetical protein